MKVHLANLFGFNKGMLNERNIIFGFFSVWDRIFTYSLSLASFLERIAWTEKHLPQALDSAANPLDGGQWWLEAEDPWQALATCRELRGFERFYFFISLFYFFLFLLYFFELV